MDIFISLGVTRKCKQAIRLDASHRRQTQEGWVQTSPVYVQINILKIILFPIIRIRVFHVSHELRDKTSRRGRQGGVWNIDQGRINRTTEYKWVHLQRKEQREFRRTNSRPKTSLLFFHPPASFVAWRGPRSLRNPPTIDQMGGRDRHKFNQLATRVDVLPRSRVKTFPRR